MSNATPSDRLHIKMDAPKSEVATIPEQKVALKPETTTRSLGKIAIQKLNNLDADAVVGVHTTSGSSYLFWREGGAFYMLRSTGEMSTRKRVFSRIHSMSWNQKEDTLTVEYRPIGMPSLNKVTTSTLADVGLSSKRSVGLRA